MGMEMRTLRLLSAFHDHTFAEEKEVDELCNLLMSLRVNPILFQHMSNYLQDANHQEQANHMQRQGRIQIRHSKLIHAEKNNKHSAENFQAWTAQQRFSAISSKHMQLILYFIVVQTEDIPMSYYASHYSSVICERIKNARTTHCHIDYNALLVLIKSIRTYSCKIQNLVSFASECLNCLTQRARQNLSKVEILQLYIIMYQHESVLQKLWQQILPEFGHTMQENLKNFRKRHACDYLGVLNNLLMVHRQNEDFRYRTQQSS